jgi:23S rRNA pseudouridine955/2504/2580 synthase
LSTSDLPSDAAPRSAVQQVLIGAEEAGVRLDKVLARLLPAVPRTRIFRLIRKGEVRVNGKRSNPEQRLLEGDRLRVPPVRAQSESGVGAAGAPGADTRDHP